MIHTPTGYFVRLHPPSTDCRHPYNLNVVTTKLLFRDEVTFRNRVFIWCRDCMADFELPWMWKAPDLLSVVFKDSDDSW